MAGGPCAGDSRPPGGFGRIRERSGDPVGERRRVSPRDYPAGRAVGQRVDAACGVGGDDGDPGGHRFEQDDRKPFLEARQDEEVAARHLRHRVARPRPESDDVPEPEGASARFKRRAFGALAKDV